MTKEIKIALYLGWGDKGRARLKALREMAREQGCFWGGDPSPGRFISAQIDEWLAQRADETQQEAN